MGGGTDSAYEYYLKEYVLLKGASSEYRTLYTNTIDAANDNFVYKPLVEGDPDILFMGGVVRYDSDFYQYNDEMTHLTCFVGGMYAMGAKVFNRPQDLERARKLTNGCVWAYNVTRTGVMPEYFTVRRCPSSSSSGGSTPECHFDPATANQVSSDENQNLLNKLKARGVDTGSSDAISPVTGPEISPESDGRGGTHWQVGSTYDQPRSMINMDSRYNMRPEALESVFYMYRITGEKEWQDKGWRMFDSIQKLTAVTDSSGNIQGYSGVSDVTNNDRSGPGGSTPSSQFLDVVESFWWAETLKYAYLLFSDPSLISLDEYVFNTEAHPLKIN